MPHSRSFRRWGLATALAAVTVVATVVVAPTAQARAVHVWRVGTWHGIKGNVRSIAAALRKAKPGDWILIAPGDYHAQMDLHGQRKSDHPAGLLITTRNLHIRGMNRNRVVIDGTKAGARGCSARKADQNLGRKRKGDAPGRNGVEVYKTSGVTIQNLTVCNFLSGIRGQRERDLVERRRRQRQDRHGFVARLVPHRDVHLLQPEHPDSAAQYGIFISNSRGPGKLAHTYASNFSDSGYYVGACPNCRARWSTSAPTYNALGYSGTNSGGRLVVAHSVFDTTRTASTPTARTAPTRPARRTVAARTVARDPPAHGPAGSSGATTSTTTTTRTCLSPATPRWVPWAAA